ncbi:MAG: PTS sugar transporter subunit IIA [Planctomycetes bacterium]|nr:PTS sugar transporter subunit IIA [Planctomycetota bacterium]
MLLGVEAASKPDAIKRLIQLLVDGGAVKAADQDAVFDAVMDRESRGSTGLGEGIAVPHVRDCKHVDGLVAAFGRSDEGVPFEAIDGNPVHLIFLILGGSGTSEAHTQFLRTLASLRQHEHFLRFLRDAPDEAGAWDTIKEMLESLA